MKQTWFLVSTSNPEFSEDIGPDLQGRTFILFKSRDVQSLLELANFGQFTCDSIQVVSPGHINGSSGWQVEHLIAVWLAEEPEIAGEKVEIYEVDSGGLYSRSMLGTPAEDLIHKTLAFKVPRAP